MKSKQINFFLTRDDVESFYQFLLSAGWRAIPFKLETPLVKLTDEKPNEAFFVLKHQVKDVVTKYIEVSNSYKVQIDNSPAIEFWMPAVDDAAKTLSRGRLFLTCEYFNADGLVEKNSEFLNASKNLLSWFRRQLITVKNDEFSEILISQNAQKWATENNGRFIKNNLI